MKKRLVAGLLAIAAMLLTFGSTMAGSPGDHPVNALPLSDGQAVTIPANATLWYFAPYPSGYQVEIGLKTQGQSGMGFDVFTMDQAMVWLSNPQTNPMGRGSPNSNSPNYNLTWSGRLVQGGSFYVLLKNTNAFPVQVFWGYRAWLYGSLPVRVVVYKWNSVSGQWVPYDTSTSITTNDYVNLRVYGSPDGSFTTFNVTLLTPGVLPAGEPTSQCGGSPCYVFPRTYSANPSGTTAAGWQVAPDEPRGTYTYQARWGGQVNGEASFTVK